MDVGELHLDCPAPALLLVAQTVPRRLFHTARIKYLLSIGESIYDGSSGIPWRIHSLVKKILHRHRAGFEPQRASSFMKRV